MSCQICVEVCPFEAIKMDKVYELSRRERFDALLMQKSDLAKSNDYYHRIHPREADRGRCRARRRRRCEKETGEPTACSGTTGGADNASGLNGCRQ